MVRRRGREGERWRRLKSGVGKEGREEGRRGGGEEERMRSGKEERRRGEEERSVSVDCGVVVLLGPAVGDSSTVRSK